MSAARPPSSPLDLLRGHEERRADHHAFGREPAGALGPRQAEVGQLRELSVLQKDVLGFEDVVQETFLRAYRHLEEFEARSQVGSWLYRIGANCAYDVLRARQRRETLVPVDGGESDEVGTIPSPAPRRSAWR